MNDIGKPNDVPLDTLVDKLMQLVVARCDRRLIDGTLGGGAFTALSDWQANRKIQRIKDDAAAAERAERYANS